MQEQMQSSKWLSVFGTDHAQYALYLVLLIVFVILFYILTSDSYQQLQDKYINKEIMLLA